MVEHRILTDQELEEHNRGYDCTGVTARWCPIHCTTTMTTIARSTPPPPPQADQ